MDPIADFLTAIRNGYLSKKESVSVPYSKVKAGLAQLLVAQGFLTASAKVEDTHPKLQLTLHYMPTGAGVLTGIKRISKPGVRRYAAAGQIPSALSGAGITIVSTSQGLMTDKDAKKKHLGGEVMCQVW